MLVASCQGVVQLGSHGLVREAHKSFYFEFKGNLTYSKELNTGEAGDIYRYF